MEFVEDELNSLEKEIFMWKLYRKIGVPSITEIKKRPAASTVTHLSHMAPVKIIYKYVPLRLIIFLLVV